MAKIDGYTPVLQSLGLSREEVLRMTGQSPTKRMRFQKALDRSGLYKNLFGNKHVRGSFRLESDLGWIYALASAGLPSGFFPVVEGVQREAINKHLRQRGLTLKSPCGLYLKHKTRVTLRPVLPPNCLSGDKAPL